MKISELIEKLQEISDEYGDLEVLGRGHPGEIGSELTAEELRIKKSEGDLKFYFSW